MEQAVEASKTAPVAGNPLFGTWKLESMVYEASANGQRSWPYGDHPDGYLSYSPDGRIYAIDVDQARLRALSAPPMTMFISC
jgi:hypothetical protein